MSAFGEYGKILSLSRDLRVYGGIAIITVLIQIFPAMGLTGPKKFLDDIVGFPEKGPIPSAPIM
jgi:hypothetical protein